jgi:fibronectin type 3 domain-containing protein/TolB-like protein
MLKKSVLLFGLFVIFFCFATRAEASKVSVFNFATLNMESSGLGTEVTNLLANTLKDSTAISLLDRKDLETFLNFNDLQQNDQLDNVTKIGSKLGLDFIIVGHVEKRSSNISINCKVIQIDAKQIVYNGRASAIGETALKTEIAKLGHLIIKEINKVSREGSDDKSLPSCPPNLQKFPGTKKISLRWQEIPGFAVAGYAVFRAIDKEGPFAMLGQTETNEYTDHGLDSSTIYYYKVRGFDKSGRYSQFTEVISASTDFAPNSPIILKTEGRAKSIQIIWVSSPIKSDDKSQLAGYKIYRSKNEEGSYKELTKIGSSELNYGRDGKIYYQDKELSDSETFYYRIIAYNEKGIESDFCHPIKGTSLSTIASVKTQSDLIREVKLSWSSHASTFIAAYNIYRSSKADGDFVKIKQIPSSGSDGGALTYSDEDDLGDKIKYFYRITVEDDWGVETNPSYTVSAVTRDIPPQNQKLKARSGLVKKVELTWIAATQEEIEGYNIYCSTEKDGNYTLLKKIPGRENNSYVDNYRGFEKIGDAIGGKLAGQIADKIGATLDDNKTYYYRLTTYNKASAESLPDFAFAKTKPCPQKTTGIKGIGMKPREVPLTWKANPEKDISSYHVYRSSEEKGDFAKVGTSEKTAYVDTGLNDGVKYFYKISAEDQDGLISMSSEIISVTTKPKPKPPASLKGNYKNGKAEILWAPNKETDISHYIIYEKKYFGVEKIAETKSANFVDSSIEKGTEKKYVIKAIDRDGLDSEFSAELSVSSK